MRKHNKYDLLKEYYALGLIKEFRDIFKYLRPTPIAKKLGREKGRFNELIDDPSGFTMHELMLLSTLWNLSLDILGQLIETQRPRIIMSYSPENPDYRVASLRIDGGMIVNLTELFDVIGFEAAKKMGRKPETVKQYLDHVEKFQVEDFEILADRCEVSLSMILKLFEAQYAIQMQKHK